MSKIFISSGCSYSECTTPRKFLSTWPRHLEDILVNHGYNEFVHGGLGSQGNGLISRKAIYNVTEALKNYKASDILVGIMWSGPDRGDYRCFSPELLKFKNQDVHNGWQENPTSFVKGAPNHWVIMNHSWSNDPMNPKTSRNRSNPECKIYYENFYDMLGSTIYTLEHMLRVQWFLKCNNIKYFFTTYQDFVLQHNIQDIETSYLYSMLDKDNFLPVTSEAGFLNKRCGRHEGEHPITEEHKIFTDEIILPWLKQKNII